MGGLFFMEIAMLYKEMYLDFQSVHDLKSMANVRRLLCQNFILGIDSCERPSTPTPVINESFANLTLIRRNNRQQERSKEFKAPISINSAFSQIVLK